MNITIYNKGKRTFNDLTDADGNKKNLGPGESITMDETQGLRMVNAYQFDLSTAGATQTTSEDILREKQSLHDKKTAITAKEKKLAEREKKLDEREAGLDAREDALNTREAEAKNVPGKNVKTGKGKKAKE